MRAGHLLARASALALTAISAACSAALGAPDLGGLYNRAAKQSDAERNPIIVIPGILGSRLVDPASGTVVWGAFGPTSADPDTLEGAQLVALPMQEGRALAELRDAVVPDGVVDRVHVQLLRLPIEQQAYFHLLGALGAGGYRDERLGLAGAIDYGREHFTCFQFAYDWRRDNVENARRLHAFVLEKREYVRRALLERYGKAPDPLKFDIVAHSMGGLVTRYFLMYGSADLPPDGAAPVPSWEGSRYVERAVLIGTPNAGSAFALDHLVNGIAFSALLPEFDAALLATMPAIYQLLPRARHARVVERGSGAPQDPYDPELWRRMRWGLASPAQGEVLERLLPGVSDPAARGRIADDHLVKVLARARRFAEALDVPATPPPGTSIDLIAGDAVPTASVLAVDSTSGAIEALAREPGDGTVTRSSAVMDERLGGAWTPRLVTPIGWDHVTFFFQDHLGLTRDPAFTDNLLFLLLEKPRSVRRSSP
jgi:hypothetical protein